MTRKTTYFERWSWFKFNSLALVLCMDFKFYTSMPKGLKLKVRKFWRLIPTFVEVTREKPVGEPFYTSTPPPPPFLRIPPSWIKSSWINNKIKQTTEEAQLKNAAGYFTSEKKHGNLHRYYVKDDDSEF